HVGEMSQAFVVGDSDLECLAGGVINHIRTGNVNSVDLSLVANVVDDVNVGSSQPNVGNSSGVHMSSEFNVVSSYTSRQCSKDVTSMATTPHMNARSSLRNTNIIQPGGSQLSLGNSSALYLRTQTVNVLGMSRLWKQLHLWVVVLHQYGVCLLVTGHCNLNTSTSNNDPVSTSDSSNARPNSFDVRENHTGPPLEYKYILGSASILANIVVPIFGTKNGLKILE
ncbi:hypothetical protein Tco_1529877, partial [Tanacetum coccineum]